MYKHRYIALIARKVWSLCLFDDFLKEIRSSCDALFIRQCFIQALEASSIRFNFLALPPSVERKGLGKLAWYFEIGISSNFGDFGNFLVPPLISKNLKTQIQILKMLICRGVIISFPPSPTKAVYEMKPFMFLPVQCIADEKYHFNMTLISAFVTIQLYYNILCSNRQPL